MEKRDGRSLACGYSVSQKISVHGVRQSADNSFAVGGASTNRLIGEQREMYSCMHMNSVPLAVGRGDAAPRYADVCGLKAPHHLKNILIGLRALLCSSS